jgi:hypothetical protein
LLLPLLWSLVVDKILWGFNDDYGNDIAIVINGKFHQTGSEVSQTDLGIV